MKTKYEWLRKLNSFLGKRNGEVHWIVNALFWIRTPCLKFYQKQSGIKYNLIKDEFTIHGKEFEWHIFEHFDKLADSGQIVRIVRNGNGYLFELIKTKELTNLLYKSGTDSYPMTPNESFEKKGD